MLIPLVSRFLKLFRPPWGRIDVRSAGYLIFKGLRLVMWSIDSTDYKKAGADDIMSSIRSMGLKGGDIILLHDDNEHTMVALPRLVEAVRSHGLTFGNLSNQQ